MTMYEKQGRRGRNPLQSGDLARFVGICAGFVRAGQGRSDDYAYTNAREYAKQWNEREGRA